MIHISKMAKFGSIRCINILHFFTFKIYYALFFIAPLSTRNFVSLKQMCRLTLHRNMHTKFGMIWTYSDKVMLCTRKSRRWRRHRRHKKVNWSCYIYNFTNIIIYKQKTSVKGHKIFQSRLIWLFSNNSRDIIQKCLWSETLGDFEIFRPKTLTPNLMRIRFFFNLERTSFCRSPNYSPELVFPYSIF